MLEELFLACECPENILFFKCSRVNRFLPAHCYGYVVVAKASYGIEHINLKTDNYVVSLHGWLWICFLIRLQNYH